MHGGKLYANVELYTALKQAVEPVMPKDGANSERKRWDALWASGFNVSPLYKAGFNDAHIDTALKQIASFKD